jgi:dipeptidyl aminopeptidase/acylaminoacyl peptidase
MWRIARRILLFAGAVLIGVVGALGVYGVPAPPGFTVEGMPRIPWVHVWRSTRIVRSFGALRTFAGWYGHERRMLVNYGSDRHTQRLDAPNATPVELDGLPVGAPSIEWNREIRPFFVYALDEGGSERYRLYRYDLDTHQSTPLTDKPARAYGVGFDPQGQRIAFASNERNGMDSDIYVVDVANPASRRMVFRGDGDFVVECWTGNGQLIMSRTIGMRERVVYLLDPESGHAEPVLAGTGGVQLTIARPAREGPSAFVVANLDGTEFAGVHAFDPTSFASTSLTPALRWDVMALAAMADGRTLALLVNEDAVYRLYFLDLVTKTLEPAAVAPDGFPLTVYAHPTLPIVALDIVNRAGIPGVWTYDLGSRSFEPWTGAPDDTTRPAPQVIHYPTFDDDGPTRRQIPAVLFPASPESSGRHSVLIEIHGGPTEQALARAFPQDVAYDPELAVIRPHVRGSTGYGRRYESLDDKDRREDAVKDIGALLDWIQTRPDLDASHVAVLGASYGGYLTLASLVHFSDRLKCGVDMFGISDLPAFIDESERGHFPEAQRGEFGDARDTGVRQWLQSISPASQADRIRVPLFIFQGANDVRVKPSQSRAMVARISRYRSSTSVCRCQNFWRRA